MTTPQQALCLNCLEPKSNPGVCSLCGVDDRNMPDVINSISPGSILQERYLIGRILGAGGFGITYLAYDLRLQIKMAIKEYLPSGIASRRMGQTQVQVITLDEHDHYQHGLEKFLDEAKLLAKFNVYPGIVTIRDYFSENNTAYIVMSYLEGMTLKEYLRLKGGSIPYEQALEIMTPVMDTLREVHKAEILHRDISPDNILITKEKQVKVLDFGAARYSIGDVTKSLSIILKPGYAPEEQYRTTGKQGAWTDVYAVAATFYHCVTGILPPGALDRMDEDTLKPLHEVDAAIPEKIAAAMMKALSIRARDRFQTMEQFQQALVQGNGKRIAEDVLQPPPAPESASNSSGNAPASAAPAPASIKMPIWLWAVLGAGFFAVLVTIIVLATAGGTDEQVVKSDDEVEVEQPRDQSGEQQEESNDSAETTEPAIATISYANMGVNIGDYVVFGTYNDVPIRWRVVHREKNGNPMLFSERILSLKSFDSGDYGATAGSGSNDFLYSNLRIWLNSFDGSVNWFGDSPNANRVEKGYNAYDQEPGFLSIQNFSNYEQSLLVRNKHKILLSTNEASRRDGGSEPHSYNPNDSRYSNIATFLGNYERAYYENVEEIAFPLSVKQLQLYVYNQSDVLGNYHIALPTAEAVANSQYKNTEFLSDSQTWYYWLSSPWAETYSGVRVVEYDGDVTHASAEQSMCGVRPALYIDHTRAMVYENGNGTVNNPYVIER